MVADQDIDLRRNLGQVGGDLLFFAAGPGDEAHGLFGRIDFVPPPGQPD